MIRTSVLAASAFAVVALAGCSQSVDTSKDADAIRVGEVQWNASVASKDVAGFIGHYAPNVVMMNPGEPAVSGTQAAQTAINETFKDPNFSLIFSADRVEVSKGGDMAYSQGHFTESQTDPTTHAKVTGAGSYVTVYEKQADGSWKAVADIASAGPASK
jgi:ketosteroid isomerase-like protein